MEYLVVLEKFALALALGALIGLEREYSCYKKKAPDYAGIRTFPLIALFGALSTYLAELFSIWILIISTLLAGLLGIAAYIAITRRTKVHFGATSELAGFLTFFIGVLAYLGEYLFAIVLTISITVILYARTMLHHFAERIQKKELADTLKFAVVAFVILPFLPNRGYGPLEIFNPYIIWLMVVFISGISFVGYILLKWIGERGIILSGILGGLISSTAVTSSFALRSKKEKHIYRALVLGVILANGIMFIRILIEVFVINRNLFPKVFLPMTLLIITTAIFSYLLWKKAGEAKGEVELGSPFTLGPALKFGAFFAVILALVKVADYYLSSQGVYLVSFISGLADVDAITVSLSQLAGTTLIEKTARNGIVLAALTNVAVKGGIAYWFGERKSFGKIILGFFILLILIGVLTLFI